MSIAIEDVTNFVVSDTDPWTPSHTVPAGTTLMVCCLRGQRSASDPLNSLIPNAFQWNGDDLTMIEEQDNHTTNRQHYASIYYLKNPDIGSYSFNIHFQSGPNDLTLTVYCLSGTDATDPIGASVTDWNTSATDCHIDITTTQANSLIIVDAYGQRSDYAPNLVASGSITERHNYQWGNGYSTQAAGDRAVTTAQLYSSIGWTSNNCKAAVNAVEILEAAATRVPDLMPFMK